MRTSSDEYTIQNTQKWVHLTNNCLQKYGNNYGIHEEGNTLSFDVLREYLRENYSKYKANFDEHIVPRIKDLIIDTYAAVRHICNPKSRCPCFELLGFDFMIDEDIRTWLIECNDNPYIGIPNKFIQNLLPHMLNQMLEITLDSQVKPQSNPFQDFNNDWELLFSERLKERRFMVSVNQRRPFDTSEYPIEDLRPIDNKKSIFEDVAIVKMLTSDIDIPIRGSVHETEYSVKQQVFSIKEASSVLQVDSLDLMVKKIFHIFIKQLPGEEQALKIFEQLVYNFGSTVSQMCYFKNILKYAFDHKSISSHSTKIKLLEIALKTATEPLTRFVFYDQDLLTLAIISCFEETNLLIIRSIASVLYLVGQFKESFIQDYRKKTEIIKKKIYLECCALGVLAFIAQMPGIDIESEYKNQIDESTYIEQKEVIMSKKDKRPVAPVWEYLDKKVGLNIIIIDLDLEIKCNHLKSIQDTKLVPILFTNVQKKNKKLFLPVHSSAHQYTKAASQYVINTNDSSATSNSVSSYYKSKYRGLRNKYCLGIYDYSANIGDHKENAALQRKIFRYKNSIPYNRSEQAYTSHHLHQIKEAK